MVEVVAQAEVAGVSPRRVGKLVPSLGIYVGIDAPTQRCREGGTAIATGGRRAARGPRPGPGGSPWRRASIGSLAPPRMGPAPGVGWWPGQRDQVGHQPTWARAGDGGGPASCQLAARSGAPLRSLLTRVPKGSHPAGLVGSPQVGPDLLVRSILGQASAEAVRMQHQRAVGQLEERLCEAVRLLDEAGPDRLAIAAFPRGRWRRLGAVAEGAWGRQARGCRPRRSTRCQRAPRGSRATTPAGDAQSWS